MAFHLQNIYGTEQDRVNCPFYYKIGACTFGDRCARLHNKPTESQTILLANIYHTPYNQYGSNSEPLFNVDDARSHLDDFYEDIFIEMEQFGELEEIFVCRNLGDHLVGNVYVKFYDEDDTTKALDGLRGRYYAGRPVVIELSPVTDFREARCRQYDVGECNRGGFCNFMHLGEPSRETQDKLFSWQRKLQRRKRAAKKKAETEQRDKERAEREKERAERDKDRKQEPADDRRSSTRKSRWDRQSDGGDVDRERRERENERRDRERADKERRDRRRERDIDEEGDRDTKRRKDEEEEKPQVYDVALPPNFDGDEDVKNEDDNIKTEVKGEDEIKMELEAQ